MKRFSFRLEQVRKWREDQAELEEMRLEQLHAALRAIEAQRCEIAAAAEASRRAVLAQPSLTAAELSSIEAVHEYTKQEMRRLHLEEQIVKARIDEQRQIVLEARRRFQLLDGLRDKSLIAWTAARDKEEEDLGAELFLSRLAKRSRF